MYAKPIESSVKKGTQEHVMGFLEENGIKKYFFNTMFFKVRNMRFQIIESRIPDNMFNNPNATWIDVIHTVKNLDTKEYAELSMRRLVEIFYENGLIT